MLYEFRDLYSTYAAFTYLWKLVQKDLVIDTGVLLWDQK